MKILVFGASGHVGMAIVKALKDGAYTFGAVVRSASKAHSLEAYTNDVRVAEVTQAESIKGLCAGYEVLISALGKSVSPFDKSKATFHEVDYLGNRTILEEAKRSGIKKFIYISAFHAERYTHLEYFRVHHAFGQALMASGLEYTIVKPPAVFSAYQDMVTMAKKGQLVNIGAGDKKTNPIFEGDLAKVVVEAIKGKVGTIEAGGKKLYTRRQLNELVQQRVRPNTSLKQIPQWLFKSMLPLLRMINKNQYHKFAFFLEVLQEDTIAPQVGNTTFEEYLQSLQPKEQELSSQVL